MNIKRFLTFSALALALSTGAATASTLKIAVDSGAKGSPSGDAIERWGDLIKEGTGGDLKTRLFYQNQLGGQQEVFDQHIAGDVQLMLNWPMTSYDKRIALLYTPYMFTTWEGALNAYQPGGWLNKLLDGVYQDNGLKFFAAWPEGFTGIATKGKYALTIAEAKDIKLRVAPVFPITETVEALGYQTTSIDWGEVFTSIQTGIVDGDGTNVIFYAYEYFRDTLDYFVLTRQQFNTGVLSMTLAAWDRLTPEQQKVVQESAAIVASEQFAAAKNTDDKVVEKWIAFGNEYIKPSDEQLKQMATTVRGKVWPQMAKEIGADLMDAVENNAEKL